MYVVYYDKVCTLYIGIQVNNSRLHAKEAAELLKSFILAKPQGKCNRMASTKVGPT